MNKLSIADIRTLSSLPLACGCCCFSKIVYTLVMSSSSTAISLLDSMISTIGNEENDETKSQFEVPSDLKELLSKYNQSHILSHVNDIQTLSDFNHLIEQIRSIDFEFMHNLYKRALSEEKNIKNGDQKVNISPFPHSDAFDIDSIGDVDKLCNIGYNAIAESKCAVIILAGGQGTRLNFAKPKGCYDINIVSNKSIYQLQIEKMLSVKESALKHSKSKKKNVHFPIFFMTSEATHNETFNFLQKHKFFGCNSTDIHLFKQQQFPCLNEENGQIIMKSAHQISMSPNGNGGIYSSLLQSGMLSKMSEYGIEYVQVFGIDNILARIGDPLWFGHMIESNADCSNKTCLKQDPHEKVGIMCLMNGKPAVTEYTELSKEMIELKQKTNANALEYCYGNLAMHQFAMKFVKKICNDKDNKYALPIHIARKKIPFYDAKKKQTEKPNKNNGIKLEFFVFDTFRFCEKCTVYNIERNAEFAPVKNAKGKDSPLTAKIAHSRYWKERIVANGGKFENENAMTNDELLCEVSPLFAYLPYDEEKLKEKVNGKTFKLPFYFE